MKKTKILRFVSVVVLLLGCLRLGAQHAEHAEHTEKIWEENLTVAYDTPFSYTLDEDVTWELRNGEKSVIKGKGGVENYVFRKPGNYTLYIEEHKVHNPNGCNHAHFPAKLNITVSPMKMVFDFSTVKFSKNITAGKSAKGITLAIDADYVSYDGKTARYTNGFGTFGVGSTIAGTVKNGEKTLHPGRNTLEFLLDGQAEKGNPVQMNFVDINGLVQSYGLKQIIQ
ncbi:MAG: hypothetical protein QM564_02775 [Bergeyella sp.]